MSKNLNQSHPPLDPSVVVPASAEAGEMASNAMARRRMLIKSLGKGSSVIAAAAIPMHTLAAARPLSVTSVDGKRCTISGTMSGVHSKETVIPICTGYSPGYYKTISHWQNYNITTGLATNYIGTKQFTQNSTFTFLFGGTSSIGNKSLIDIMLQNSNTDEFHWIAALLNSLPGSVAVNYPYSPSEVIGFYNSTTLYSKALTFFKNYMEVHT